MFAFDVQNVGGELRDIVHVAKLTWCVRVFVPEEGSSEWLVVCEDVDATALDEVAAFSQLKGILSSAPVAAYPNFKKEFILCTDASGIGIGAVLMQEDVNNRRRPVAYTSTKLRRVEQNYSVMQQEALAVVWALKHFKDMIFGYPVHVLTDHGPVTNLSKGKKISGKLARWQLIIQGLNPTFQYLPGRLNTAADAHSRNIDSIETNSANHNNYDVQHLIDEQRKVSFCSPITYFLESGDKTQFPKLLI